MAEESDEQASLSSTGAITDLVKEKVQQAEVAVVDTTIDECYG